MRDTVASRWQHLALVGATTVAATVQLWTVLRINGLTGTEIALLCAFTVLFAWIATWFWIAWIGAQATRRGMNGLPAGQATHESARRDALRSRTAVVMPVYNEEVIRLFAGVQAIYESVRATGAIDRFDFYILSDSTDPEHWIAEELEWFRLRRMAGAGARIFYRHRPENRGRKTGNIREFCENWGTHYEFMVILDADSLMTGETLVALVRLMEANPRACLIQVPPRLIGRDSLFARLHQFASSVYGPIYTSGMACLQGPNGNYWGHNAIIRMQAFIQHCGLPSLPGRAPLGGDILSHDFIEAAFLRRAGWELWMAPELGGSYEEAPPTLSDYLKRDRRWCQGNLQHMKLIFTRGFRMSSRLHLAVGVMTYLSSPLWLLLLLIFAIETFRLQQLPPVSFVGTYPVLAWPISHALELVTLVLLTAGLLYGPKLLGFFTLLRDRAALRAHGGAGRVALGVFLESVYSTLLAPITMLSHSWFVLNVLMGRSIAWGGQQRGDRRVSLASVARAFAPHTLFGLAAGGAIYVYLPGSLWWFLPLLTGLALAIPLAWLTSDPALGRAVRRLGLFVIPSETKGVPIAERLHAILAERRGAEPERKAASAALIRRVLEDPFVNGLHLALLGDATGAASPDRRRLSALIGAAHADGAGALTAQEWKLLLSDAESVAALYRRAHRPSVSAVPVGGARRTGLFGRK